MIKLIFRFLLNKYKIFTLKKNNIRFLYNVKVSGNCNFEGYNSIGINNVLSNCNIGLGSYTGSNVNLTNVQIGKFCSIASDVKNIVGRHPIKEFVSTHPSFFSTGKAAGFTFSKKQIFKEKKVFENSFSVKIGNDVWIGENVRILDGIKIGNGAVIGANSLITKNIEPYSVNFGVPSKLIKYRFDNNTIINLEKIKWWDWSFEKINKEYLFFSNVEEFIKKYKN